MTRARLVQILAALGMAIGIRRPADAQAPAVIRVGGNADDGITPLLYAMQNGSFRTAGVDIQLAASASGAAVAAAIAGGSLDIAKASMMALISAHARGINFKVVLGNTIFSSGAPTTELCVLKGGPIQNAGDLTGKTIGVISLGALDMLGTQALIDQRGGNSAAVRYVEMPQGSMLDALERGRIDVATLSNPLLADAMAGGKIAVWGIPFSGISNRLMISAWFCSDDYAQRNADTVKKFAVVIRSAQAYANTHHAQTLPLLAAYAHLDSNVIRNMDRNIYATSSDPSMIQPAIDVAVKYKVIDKPFAASELILPGV
jgi:NitT/TauT family transport system substrate-binding protein